VFDVAAVFLGKLMATKYWIVFALTFILAACSAAEVTPPAIDTQSVVQTPRVSPTAPVLPTQPVSATKPLPTAAPARATQNGVLQGHVLIGPLTPVQRVGQPEPTPAPEVYAARQIVVYQADGKTEVARLKIDSQGNYRVELPPGTYVVAINRGGIDRGAGLPATIQITAGQTSTLDISIDTGIR
jgi:hypothetical protein